MKTCGRCGSVIPVPGPCLVCALDKPYGSIDWAKAHEAPEPEPVICKQCGKPIKGDETPMPIIEVNAPPPKRLKQGVPFSLEDLPHKKFTIHERCLAAYTHDACHKPPKE